MTDDRVDAQNEKSKQTQIRIERDGRELEID